MSDVMPKAKKFYNLSKKLRSTFADLHAQFISHLNTVEQTQWKKLQDILNINQHSLFGQAHYFSSIKNVDHYRQTIPIRKYEEYLPFIDLIKLGQRNILSKEPIQCFEPTSGSTGVCKLIPYTKSLYQEFQNGIAPWLYDLYKNHDIASGNFYWSITPVSRNNVPFEGNMPIGTANDFDFFTNEQQKLLSSLSAVPFEINKCVHINDFKKNTLINLLLAENLSFVSIWNPSFFTLLLEYFFNNAEEILSSLTNKSRRAYLRDRYNKCRNSKEFFSEVWPSLKLISCWSDANAELHAAHLKTYFPSALIQGKGLMSTEAFVSFPFSNLPGPILSIRSHFFEFKPLNKTENTYLAHELGVGNQYEIIITTSGGLYRYNTEDIVEIIGFHHQTPLLKFIGRNDVIDHVGEKINELQLIITLKKLHLKLLNHTHFLLCSPEKDAQKQLRYTLFLDTQDTHQKLFEFAEQLENSLMENFHYHYARKLGQLEKVGIYKIHDGQHTNEIYLKKHFDDGKQLGQIKPAYIDKSLGWSAVFKGEWL